MKWENAKSHPKLIYFFVISACLNLLLIPSILSNFYGLKDSIFNDEIVASIVTSQEDEEFIKEMCEDLGIDSEITMVIGPYYIHSFFSQTRNYHLNRLLSKYPIVIDPKDPAGRILMEESTYIKLSKEHRHAALAHEIGHIYMVIEDGPIAQFDPDREFKANRIAARYVSPDSIIDFYRTYGDNTPGVNELIEDLEKRKL